MVRINQSLVCERWITFWDVCTYIHSLCSFFHCKVKKNIEKVSMQSKCTESPMKCTLDPISFSLISKSYLIHFNFFYVLFSGSLHESLFGVDRWDGVSVVTTVPLCLMVFCVCGSLVCWTMKHSVFVLRRGQQSGKEIIFSKCQLKKIDVHMANIGRDTYNFSASF